MCISIFLLWLVSIPFATHAVPESKGYLINCGSKEEVEINGLKYIPDDEFITVGNGTVLENPPDHLLPILSTLRYFPVTELHKFCYNFPVIKGAKFLVRTTYFYFSFDNHQEPPVFDQIIDGTKWSVVNTSEDHDNGLSSYYEIVVTSHSKTLSVCLAKNERTVSPPFISAIEIQMIEESVYNGTDFGKYGLITVARASFGAGDIISYPDDEYDRFWHPFVDHNLIDSSNVAANSSDFWNKPPAKVFATGISTSREKTVVIKWPPFRLPTSHYYIVLYFKDGRGHTSHSYRVCNVTVNRENFYTDLVVPSKGVAVYGKDWPLSGETEIVLNTAPDSLVPPVINAGEIFRLLPLSGKTLTRDAIVMEALAKSFENPPPDWTGDPCMPKSNPWTGLACSEGKNIRVVSLNLTGYGLRGTLPKNLDKLTALNHLLLGGNNLTGTIPEMGSLKSLETLHLEGNQFEGPVPKSLNQLPRLRELNLENNRLIGELPKTLSDKTANNVQVSPGQAI
ncbi:hypothetical protein LguiA_008846 [Lonicera macranthoides]